MRSHRQAVVLETEARIGFGEHIDDRLQQVLGSPAALEIAVDLLGGLFDVAEVGDECARVRPDEREAVRAGVAGQVADVDEVRDQQEVDTRLGQQGDQALDARALGESSARRSSRASR
jgi:hypothetical protein